jgi:hypothetical protein
MPVEADRGGVVAEYAVARLADRAGEVPDEFGGLEMRPFGEHGGQTAIAKVPLAAPVSLGDPIGEQQQPIIGVELDRMDRVTRRAHLWGSRSRPEPVTCSDRRPMLQA